MGIDTVCHMLILSLCLDPFLLSTGVNDEILTRLVVLGSAITTTPPTTEILRARDNPRDRVTEPDVQDSDASSIDLEDIVLNPGPGAEVEQGLGENGVDNIYQNPEDGFGHRLVRWMLRPLRSGAWRDFTRHRIQIIQQLRDFDRIFHPRSRP